MLCVIRESRAVAIAPIRGMSAARARSACAAAIRIRAAASSMVCESLSASLTRTSSCGSSKSCHQLSLGQSCDVPGKERVDAKSPGRAGSGRGPSSGTVAHPHSPVRTTRVAIRRIVHPWRWSPPPPDGVPLRRRRRVEAKVTIANFGRPPPSCGRISAPHETACGPIPERRNSCGNAAISE